MREFLRNELQRMPWLHGHLRKQLFRLLKLLRFMPRGLHKLLKQLPWRLPGLVRRRMFGGLLRKLRRRLRERLRRRLFGCLQFTMFIRV